MHYLFNEEHQTLQEQVRNFSEKEVRPQVQSMENNKQIEEILARKIARKGWIGVTIPTKYGGMGMGHLSKTIIIEELARVSGAMGAMAQASQLGVAKVIHFGNEEQKQKWLPRFADGESLPTIAVTEPESGGHVLAMKSSAVREGDEYVLNGRKWFVGNSHIGDVHGVVVRTGEGSKGLSAFLLESDRKGFSLGEYNGKAGGLHGFSFGEIIFENCRVPIENRIGEEGDGLNVAYSSSILYGRLNLTAVALGIHQAVLEDTVKFCNNRIQYGKPLSQLPSIQMKIGNIYNGLETARLITYHASRLLDQGKDCDRELMMAKLTNTEGAFESVKEAIDIFGARGCYRDYNLDRYLRDTMCTFPAAGTSDIQRLRLSQLACGQNRGSWSDKLSDLVKKEGTLLMV